jgi:hypothetical protein
MRTNIYYYLYYKIYVFTRKLGNYEVAFSATLGITFLISLNISIPILKLLEVDKNIFNSLKPILFILFSSFLLINYFIFNHNNKYKKIISIYKDESKKAKIVGDFVVIIYVIITFSLIFF